MESDESGEGGEPGASHFIGSTARPGCLKALSHEDVSWGCLMSFGSSKSLTKHENSGDQFFEISKVSKLGFWKRTAPLLRASGLR